MTKSAIPMSHYTLLTEPPSILSLPFVRDTTEPERAAGLPSRIFWDVTPSGNYTADVETGAHFAQLALNYMIKKNFAGLLGWAVFDMMRHEPERSGIEVGFLSAFARYSMAGKHASDVLLLRD